MQRGLVGISPPNVASARPSSAPLRGAGELVQINDAGTFRERITGIWAGVAASKILR
ncbi:MAG: hypothetical protein KGL39_27760 [Patescibacteria group bacterium]|nr:hypothetical protein [Patescibacteria group bacterium]